VIAVKPGDLERGNGDPANTGTAVLAPIRQDINTDPHAPLKDWEKRKSVEIH
jgi:hypothetical protein